MGVAERHRLGLMAAAGSLSNEPIPQIPLEALGGVLGGPWRQAKGPSHGATQGGDLGLSKSRSRGPPKCHPQGQSQGIAGGARLLKAAI